MRLKQERDFQIFCSRRSDNHTIDLLAGQIRIEGREEVHFVFQNEIYNYGGKRQIEVNEVRFRIDRGLGGHLHNMFHSLTCFIFFQKVDVQSAIIHQSAKSYISQLFHQQYFHHRGYVLLAAYKLLRDHRGRELAGPQGFVSPFGRVCGCQCQRLDPDDFR